MPKPTLIDAAWSVGGNRRRGIGAYLEAFFQKYCPIVRSDRIWVLPAHAKSSDGEELVTRFGGEFVILPAELHQQQAALEELMTRTDFGTVFFASPFERPFSLIDFASFFYQKEVRTEALVFDLLPLQFPTKILAYWPEEDQVLYRQRLTTLRELDFLWSISPATQQALHEELSYPLSQTKVLRFGLKTDWLTVPDVPDQKRDPNLVMTIAGGEWRKNVEGTLVCFAQMFPKTSRLVVICKLGLKQRLQLLFLSLRLGIGTRVRFLGEVDEREKWRYLKQASAFLFLSHAEGLGIPLLEAEKAGVPRIIISQALVRAGLGILVSHPEVV